MWSSSYDRKTWELWPYTELRAASVWWTALLINFLSSNRWACQSSPGYAHHQTHDICSDHVCSNCCAHVSDSLPSLNSTRCLSCTLTVFMFSVCAISQMDVTPCLMFFTSFWSDCSAAFRVSRSWASCFLSPSWVCLICRGRETLTLSPLLCSHRAIGKWAVSFNAPAGNTSVLTTVRSVDSFSTAGFRVSTAFSPSWKKLKKKTSENLQEKSESITKFMF